MCGVVRASRCAVRLCVCVCVCFTAHLGPHPSVQKRSSPASRGWVLGSLASTLSGQPSPMGGNATKQNHKQEEHRVQERSVVLLGGRRPDGRQHLLQHCVPHAADGLILRHRGHGQEIKVTDVRCQAVAVVVHNPLAAAHNKQQCQSIKGAVSRQGHRDTATTNMASQCT